MPQDSQKITLELENIGGLKHAKFELQPGLNVVKAPNAAGKTSVVRGLTAMFQENISPSHILRLDAPVGSISINYQDMVYERRFRKVRGTVNLTGKTLPFADERAVDIAVAVPETGIIHDLTGGKSDFRDYLEKLSYAKHYDDIIMAADEIIDDFNAELVSEDFRRTEKLTGLLSEFAELTMKKERLESNSQDLQQAVNDETLMLRLSGAEAELQNMENSRAILREELTHEEGNSKRLEELLQWTVLTTLRANIEEGLKNSKDRQQGIAMKIRDLTENMERQKTEVADVRKRVTEKSEKESQLYQVKGQLKDLQEILQKRKAEMESLKAFPLDHPRYPGRSVDQTKNEIIIKVQWLRSIVTYSQGKYESHMNSARQAFNESVARVFEELELHGFKKVFLDQNNVIHVIRDNDINQPVETLSASEKLTLGIVLMLSAREAYLPEFPFFIIDEIALHYDPDRCKQAIKYLRERVPYVIITALAEKGRTIKVEHSL